MKLYKGIGGREGYNFGMGVGFDSKYIDYWTDCPKVAKLYGDTVLEKITDIPIDSTIVDGRGQVKDIDHSRLAVLDSLRREREGKNPETPIVFIDIIDTPDGYGDPHIIVGFKRQRTVERARLVVQREREIYGEW